MLGSREWDYKVVRPLRCWTGEVTTMDCYMGEGCTAGWERSAIWEKIVLLVGRDVVEGCAAG